MKRIIIVTISSLSLLLTTGCSFLFGWEEENNIKHYLKSGDHINELAQKIMPSLDSLPEYKNISYHYKEMSTEIMLLVVEYDTTTYEAEKANLDNIYTFLDHIVYDEHKGKVDRDTFLIPEYEFSVGTYDFRVIDHKGDVYSDYPKYFGMIATSDELNRIAYLYFYDQSLDCISSQSMDEFVELYFPYEW